MQRAHGCAEADLPPRKRGKVRDGGLSPNFFSAEFFSLLFTV